MTSSLRSIVRIALERAPVVLLVAVALLQIFLARSEYLLSWKGGGFGMFAVLDGVEFRELRVLDPAGAAIEIPSTLFEIERRIQIHPNRAALERLAREIEDEVEGVEVAKIEVWRSHWQGEPMRPTRERIAERAP